MGRFRRRARSINPAAPPHGSDDGSVANTSLRVRGTNDLRVADASITSALVSGNTDAAAIMVGERCADFVTSL